MNNFYVYIAGPYTKNPIGGVRVAISVADDIVTVGMVPFVPHLYHFWNEIRPHDYEHWMSLCFDWLKVCDAVFVIDISLGVQRELALAHKEGIPIYTDFNDLRMAFTTWLGDKDYGD